MQWLGREEVAARLRPVLDTNVLVSALLFRRGRLRWILHSWQSGEIAPLRSTWTLVELVRVLSYAKFGLSTENVGRVIETYLPWTESVEVPEGLTVPDPRDPNDRPFLELAIAGNADALVTGDNDLLALAPYFPVPIITPRELRERLVASN